MEEDSDFDEATFFKCPVTLKPVNPDFQRPNKKIKQATVAFIEANPWSYDFDPRQSYQQIEFWVKKRAWQDYLNNLLWTTPTLTYRPTTFWPKL